MRIKYLHKYDLTKPCVAKLWFGEKYLIIKTPDIAASVRLLIDTFSSKEGPEEGIVAFATRRVRAAILDQEAGDRQCRVEILLASWKGEELLAKEQALLNQKDRQCMNIGKTPLRPNWIYDLISPVPPAAGFFSLKGRHRAAPAIVKLWVGDKFFIWKCLDIQAFPAKFNESTQRNLDRYDPDSKNIFNPMLKYILDNRIDRGQIEVIQKARLEKGKIKGGIKRFLAIEKRLLDDSYRTTGCLNQSVKVYIPQWIKEIDNNPLNKK